jgi:hypothetical protein
MTLRLMLLASIVALPACGSCTEPSPAGGASEGTAARPLDVSLDGGGRKFSRKHHVADADAGPRELEDATPAPSGGAR